MFLAFSARWWRSAITALFCVVLAAAPARAAVAPAGLSDLVASVLPGVVNIAATRYVEPAHAEQAELADLAELETRTALGSGFIVDGSGLIVTNKHVIESAFQITVTLQDETPLRATLVGLSERTDIAIVKVTAGRPLPHVTLGDSDKMRPGDQVVAIGNPLGFGGSVTTGIVSALNRDIQTSPFDDYIQTDASINHGNSGGPLFNMSGEVIGMNTALFSPTSEGGSIGLGFSIPSNHVRNVLAQILRYGRVRPGDLQMQFQALTPDMAEALGDPGLHGPIVSDVTKGGPADRAGIHVGDVIVRFGSLSEPDSRALAREIAFSPLGKPVSMTVLRGAAEIEVAPVIAEYADGQIKDVGSGRPNLAAMPRARGMGFQLMDVTPEARARFRLDAGVAGALVTGVTPHSVADNRGLSPGDVIIKVQEADVATPADFQTRLDIARTLHRTSILLLVNGAHGRRWVALPLPEENK